MKIGVISDTHLEASHPLLEGLAKTLFKDVDLILHGGDLTTFAVLDAFKGKDVIAVAGNGDSPEVRKILPEKRVVAVHDFRVGLIHGWGLPLGLEKRLIPSFERIQCLVYGHSHWPANHYRDGILCFNPGAFSGGFFSLWRRSVGLLTIDRDIRGEIIWL